MPKHKSLYSLATHYGLEILVEAIRVDLFSCFKAVSMQIKDAQVILLVLLDWFVQNNGGYIYMSSEDQWRLRYFWFDNWRNTRRW